MPKLVKQEDETKLVQYSYLEELALEKLYGKNKERSNRLRKIIYKVIIWKV